jgi:hypothetical protein
MKVLVLYVFHIYNERVDYFIKNCIFKDDNVDFIIICNDKKYKVTTPSYVKVLFRNNIGYDFGGWSDALLINNMYNNYTHFIFVNSSVIGPYLPPSFRGKWIDIYLNGLQGNIKLFGSTINTLNQPLTRSHVQSYIFSMDKNTLQYLIQCGIFSMTNYATTFDDAIENKEILMSRKVIKNNWNIGSCMKYYKGVDFTFKTEQTVKPFISDIFNMNYYNKIWDEYELVFIKGNRGLSIPFPSANTSIKNKKYTRPKFLI